MKRRHFLTSVVALSVCGKTAFAHSDAEHDRRIGPSVVPPEHLPREVEYSEAGKPGEIHVDPNQLRCFGLYRTIGRSGTRSELAGKASMNPASSMSRASKSGRAGRRHLQ